jgi:hypothetical protein
MNRLLNIFSHSSHTTDDDAPLEYGMTSQLGPHVLAEGEGIIVAEYVQTCICNEEMLKLSSLVLFLFTDCVDMRLGRGRKVSGGLSS